MSVRDLMNSGFVLALAFLSTARSVHADRDGYYCTGPSYIAFELSPRHPTPAHVLYVVSLRDSGGIAPPTTLELPRFQVHGMRCNASSVQLLSWDSLYTVNLGASGLLAFNVRLAPCTYRVVTRLVELDAASHAVAALTLFDADTPRACGPG